MINKRWLVTFAAVAVAGPGSGQDPSSTPSGLEVDASPLWGILEGRPGGASTPSVMVAAGNRVFLFHDALISEYRADDDRWQDHETRLPAAVGPGVCAAEGAGGAVYVLRGATTRDFWRFDPAAGKVAALAPLPAPAGRGASLAFDPERGQVYAVRGGDSLDFCRYDLAANAWEKLPRVGGGKVKLAGIGLSTGAIQCSGGGVYAWPDHHVNRYDIATGTWLDRVYMSYGQRPWWNGAAFAKAPDSESWIVTQGAASRTLSSFDPAQRRFAYLRPRLPLRVTGEGSRAAIVPVKGRNHLLVYAPAQQNRLLRIPVDQLQGITAQSPASDVGSPWITLHEGSGSSLVRQPARDPVLGLMGVAGARWYFVRLGNMRFLEPTKNKWSAYPGVPFGQPVTYGLCAAWDGADHVYICAGGSSHFARVHATTLECESLPGPDPKAGRGAQMAWHGGQAWMLMGGGERAVRRSDPAARTWTPGPPLPDEAAPPGPAGSGLLVAGKDLFAFTADAGWKLGGDGTWTQAFRLPFPLAENGGMIALDAAAGELYGVEGGGSRRLAVTPLDGGPSRIVLLPDVVSVPGQRALVTTVGGRLCFVVHRGHDSHEIVMLPIAAPGAGAPKGR